MDDNIQSLEMKTAKETDESNENKGKSCLFEMWQKPAEIWMVPMKEWRAPLKDWEKPLCSWLKASSSSTSQDQTGGSLL